MKQIIINKLLSYLLKSVNPLDVVETKKIGGRDVLCLGGEPITEAEVRSLQEEIKFIEKTRWWKLVTETIRSQAMETGFNKSLSFDDMKSCKLMLYNLDIIESILGVIKGKRITSIVDDVV